MSFEFFFLCFVERKIDNDSGRFAAQAVRFSPGVECLTSDQRVMQDYFSALTT